MRTQQITLKLCAAALTLATLPLAVNQALGAEYWLKAAPAAVDLPNPLGGTISVPLWGYASCDAAFAACGAATVPGPALTVPAADSSRLTLWARTSLRWGYRETVLKARQNKKPLKRKRNRRKKRQGPRKPRNLVGDAMLSTIERSACICPRLLKPSTRPSERFRQRDHWSRRSRRSRSAAWTPSRR